MYRALGIFTTAYNSRTDSWSSSRTEDRAFAADLEESGTQGYVESMVSTGQHKRRRATYDDLLKVPDPLVAEIVDGELFASPRPAARHALAASTLGIDVGGPFGRRPGGADGPGGWWILYEPELHLGPDPDIMVPDLAGWRRERMPSVPDVAHFLRAPDWVCEVVSPTTGRLDRVHKMPAYARSGVEHLWLVDPQARSLEVFKLVQEHWTLMSTHEGAVHIRAEPFESVKLDMSRWWIEQEACEEI